MIGHRSRFRENDDLRLRRGPVVKKKPPFSNARALSRVKLCAVGMRNAILGNDLNMAGRSQGRGASFLLNINMAIGLQT